MNLIIAQLLFLCSKKGRLNQIKEIGLMKTYRFYIGNEEKYLNNDQELIKDLINICDFTEKYQNNNHYTKYVLKKNYTFIQNGMTNQKHCDELPDKLVSNLGASLMKSDIIKIANSYFKCEFSAVNLRSWIFYPQKDNKDDHIHKHFDTGFPKGTLKIMFYKGNFIKQPALTIFSKHQKFNVDGKNPIVLFESNRLLHGALAPKNKVRPTVELTLTPRFSGEAIVQQAGFQAGAPINPFKSITEEPHTLRS